MTARGEAPPPLTRGHIRTARLDHPPLSSARDAGVFRDAVRVELDAEAGAGWDREHAVGVELERGGDDLLDVWGGGQVLDPAGDRERRDQVEVGRQADGR